MIFVLLGPPGGGAGMNLGGRAQGVDNPAYNMPQIGQQVKPACGSWLRSTAVDIVHEVVPKP